MVELGDLPGPQITFPTFASFSLLWHLTLTTDQDIDDNLRLIVYDAIHAPINCPFDIDIIDGATVHENAFAFPVVRWEDTWDGC